MTEEFQNQKNKLYMKDIKNFLNLRKVATNFISRRDYENNMRMQLSPTAKEIEAE